MRRMPKRTAPSSPLLTFLFVLGFFLLLGFGILWFLGTGPLPPGRFTVLSLGDPVELATYDQDRDAWTLIQMTKDVHVSGVFGLGEYAIESLWKLGNIEGSASSILRESVAEELGITIPYYIALQRDPFHSWSVDSELSLTRSMVRLPDILNGSYRTNIPTIQLLRMWWRLRSMKLQKVERYIIRENIGMVEKQDRDGTKYLRFDRLAFDARTADTFEELSVRQEAKRVVVLNTTDRPAIGARLARMIEKLGANVVFVGNDTTASVTDCTVSGKPQALQTITSQRIEQLFDCEPMVNEDDNQGDLVVRVGELYAKRFQMGDE